MDLRTGLGVEARVGRKKIREMYIAKYKNSMIIEFIFLKTSRQDPALVEICTRGAFVALQG